MDVNDSPNKGTLKYTRFWLSSDQADLHFPIYTFPIPYL